MNTKRIHQLFIFIVIFPLLAFSCEKESNNDLSNKETEAQIIDFIPEKCYCCWGWVIKIKNDTIKADSLPNPDLIGYSIEEPISVIINIGDKKTDCSTYSVYKNKFDFYEIKKLKVND
ncbi:MAG: hypothetical protein ACOC4B_02235 [Bacteroidota bacterium]